MLRGLASGFALIAACKSPGTITLDFDLEGATCAGFGPDARYVLYAEPGVTCDDCGCGACAGAKSDGVLVCPHGTESVACEADAIHGRTLDLAPGVWAVVLEAYAGADPGTLVASQCVSITVDSDGTDSRVADPPQCVASCDH
ncbi:MAG: hypothetical protein ABI678_09475 [Kofleriaceae bacterium]